MQHLYNVDFFVINIRFEIDIVLIWIVLLYDVISWREYNERSRIMDLGIFKVTM